MRMWAYVLIKTLLLKLQYVLIPLGEFCLNADSDLAGLCNLSELPGSNFKAAGC